ncbi:MAG: hypothetical protein AAGG48_00055 [Planctomycetota bacterium]
MWKQIPLAKMLVGLTLVLSLVLLGSAARTSADGSDTEACQSDGPACPCQNAAVPAPQMPSASPSPPTRNLSAPSLPPANSHPNFTIATPPAPYPVPPSAVPPSANRLSRPVGVPLPNLARSYQPPAIQRPVSSANRSTINPSTARGLPSGTWSNETVMGDATMILDGNKVTFQFEGTGELAPFRPILRGEYSVASDGTIFGLIHSTDFGPDIANAEDMGEGFLLLSGLSDIPFSMRTYADSEMLAVKQITFGLPMQALIATEGEFSELVLYAQSILTGQYQRLR